MRLCRCIRDKNSWKSSENIQELLDFVLHNVVPYSGLQSVEGHRIHVHAPKWVKVSVLGNIRLVLKISNLPKSEYCTLRS